MQVVRFQSSHEQQWETFVAASRNGTVFHTRRFLAYHPADRFEDHSLLFFDGPHLRAVLPAAERTDGDRTLLASHPGASYGGLVLHPDATVADTGIIIDVLIEYARAEKFASLSMLRLTPASVRTQFSDDAEYWLYQRGGIVTRFEMDGSIDLRGWSDNAMLEQFSGKCRNAVRQAQRSGLTVHISEDITAFWTILETTLAARHSAHPTHTREEIERLAKLLGGDLRLFAAFDGDTMVGGILTITLHSKAVYTLYIAQNYEYQKHHPVHLILAEIIRTGIVEKRDTLHLGVSTEDGGKKVNEGLFFFKESFGMKPVRRESWEIVL
ncbi:MAG: GNAT family N-acetyltransferase [Candidatus Peribacteraceae bacterium]|nr:GNAT family N-acetyltransferase [Candidatus Peribacteraceae bacterium]